MHSLKFCSAVTVSTSDNTEFRLEFELLLRKGPELERVEFVVLCGELTALNVLLLLLLLPVS